MFAAKCTEEEKQSVPVLFYAYIESVNRKRDILMTFIYNFAEAFKILLDRKRTVAALLVISHGWVLLTISGLIESTSVMFLLYFIVLLLTIYYGMLLSYGLMRSEVPVS